RLRPEAALVDAVLVRDTLNLGGRQGALVELVGLRLVEGGLLVEVPLQVETRQVARPVPTGAGLPVRVLAQGRQLVHIVARHHVRAGRSHVSRAVSGDDFVRERQLRRRGLEERHGDLRHERSVGLGQVDRELVALDLDTTDVGALTVVDGLRSDDVRPRRIGDELRAWRGQVVVRDTVDGVLEAVRRHRLAVAELEALPDREGVLLPAVLYGERRSGRGDELGARSTRLVRIVVELRCGRIL